MFARILVATDFSAHSEQAYPWAAQLASGQGSTVVLVHVLEADLTASARAFADYLQSECLELGSYREGFRRAAEAALADAAGRIRELGAEVESHVIEGKRASESLIQAIGELNCSILVISTHGGGGLAKFLLGSTAERVVRTAPCPVFTVHHDDQFPTAS